MPREEKKKSTEENEKDRSGGISRREFTIASMAIFGAASEGEGKAITQVANKKLAQPGIASQATAKLPLTSSARKISLTVNKWKYEVYVEPEWILRDVLRDQLGFLSIKDMCNGYGACGSCTVIMDGRPVLSCMTFAADCDGMNIETAEGVAINHPQLIEAYVLNHCMQCGYCTPGFVVTAKALLDRIPKPTEGEIRDALGGNICRCGTYTQHILAIKEVTGNA
jgi:aerobic-type carbon monoxide dehydrogenase small subunit (CoxS/CutS family)